MDQILWLYRNDLIEVCPGKTAGVSAKGTCYRAANWLLLGRTTGRGYNARTKKATQPTKELLRLLRPPLSSLT